VRFRISQEYPHHHGTDDKACFDGEKRKERSRKEKFLTHQGNPKGFPFLGYIISLIREYFNMVSVYFPNPIRDTHPMFHESLL